MTPAPQLAAYLCQDAAQVLANEGHRDRRRKRPAQMKPRYAQTSAVEDGERWPHVTRPKAPYNRLNTPLRLFVCDSVKAMLEKPPRSEMREMMEGTNGRVR